MKVSSFANLVRVVKVAAGLLTQMFSNLEIVPLAQWASTTQATMMTACCVQEAAFNVGVPPLAPSARGATIVTICSTPEMIALNAHMGRPAVGGPRRAASAKLGSLMAAIKMNACGVWEAPHADDAPRFAVVVHRATTTFQRQR
jgi:hypothetical protein